MRSLGKGVMSATTKVKVLNPEIDFYALGQGFSPLEASIGVHANGECISACRGLSPWRANELFILELGRTEAFRTEAAKEAEEVTKQYGVSVVGLTHSRGVTGVMPSEPRWFGTLEGVSGLTQRGKF